MIPNEIIQEITSKIEITDIIGDFVLLKKRGANYSGLCPFHHEKTPSFSVSKPKQIFKCFGCGKSGNAISFIMEHEKLSYIETMKWFAKRYHIDIQETAPSPELLAQKQTADSLFILNEFAQEFYTQQLAMSSNNADNLGLSYLKSRGFDLSTLQTFKVGFAPQNASLSATLLKNQFQKDLILKSGLATLRNDALTDNYKERIIFPIHNLAGKIAGFGARILQQNAANSLPKYINTPETEIYNKSKILYGLFFARQDIIKNDECILVEGYTDVLALHQANIKNVVASSGTSLTQEQVLLIKKFTNNILIIYDGDDAGIKAASRGVKICLAEGLNTNLLIIPNNDDPDSFIKQFGADAFLSLLKTQKQDFVLFELSHKLRSANNDIHAKNLIVNDIAETIAQINKIEDFTKQDFYIKECAVLLDIDENKFRSLVNEYIKKKVVKDFPKLPKNEAQTLLNLSSPPLPKQDLNDNLLSDQEFSEQHFARVLLEYGSKMLSNNTQTVAQHLLQVCNNAQEIEHPEYHALVALFASLYFDNKNPQVADFIYSPNPLISLAATKCLHYSQFTPLDNWSFKDPFSKDASSSNPQHFSSQKTDLFYLDDVHSVEIFFRLNRYKKLKKLIDQKIKNTPWGKDLEDLIHASQNLDALIKDLAKQNNLLP